MLNVLIKRKEIYILLIIALCLVNTLLASEISEQIIIDQFGWRSNATKKVAIFSNPVHGQNARSTYIPGEEFEIRRVIDDVTVYKNKTMIWNNGETDSFSGDQVWWGDFSDFTVPGEYYIYDPANDVRSYPFELRNDIYNDILKSSVRAFYYQRCGTEIPERYGNKWVHPHCHIQDKKALLYKNMAKQGSKRDVSGGWHDAGDYNKYVPFVPGVLWELMMAYEFNPEVFGDDLNIPESNNGVPDIIDEIKWELDWLLKMQDSDGGVYNRVAVRSYSSGEDDPSTDTQRTYYTSKTTWATAGFAGIMAHACRIYKSFNTQFPGYALLLLSAAENAWLYLETHPTMNPSNGKDGAKMAAVDAGSDSKDDKRKRIFAASELLMSTGKTKYKSYFENNYNDIYGTDDNDMHPFKDNYIDPTLAQDLNRAYFIYVNTKGANPVITEVIKDVFKSSLQKLLEGYYNEMSDPYRAFMWEDHYTFGSNYIKARWAITAIYAIELGINVAKHDLYREIAEEFLHYFHGRNPLSLVYLSNMGKNGAGLGADKSVMEIYHYWFRDGSLRYDGVSSLFGPAPGFLVGGPNKYYEGISPPSGEPSMKAFRAWNNVSQKSWEITEPAIGYQSAYILLLSYFCAKN
jgi:endoglucanase